MSLKVGGLPREVYEERASLLRQKYEGKVPLTAEDECRLAELNERLDRKQNAGAARTKRRGQ